MRLSDILSSERILVDTDGGFVRSKTDALRILSHMLGGATGVAASDVEKALAEREKLTSTGIGDGVGIPHTYLDAASGQVAGVLLCPVGVDFDAIDGQPVKIVFGVVGPRANTGAHLKVLARISRLLRDPGTRAKLLQLEERDAALDMIRRLDVALG